MYVRHDIPLGSLWLLLREHVGGDRRKAGARKLKDQLETGPGRGEDDKLWRHSDLATNPVFAAF